MNSAILKENQGLKTGTIRCIRQLFGTIGVLCTSSDKKVAKNAQLKENMLAYFPP